MKHKPVLPCFERLCRGQGGQSGDRFGMPDDENGCVLQSGGVEQRRPVEPGSFGGQFVALPRDRAMHVLRLDARGMHRRHLRLEREHAGGARGRVLEARQLKHRRDMRLVLLPQLNHMRSCGEIVVAVRHSETALEQIRKAVGRVRQALGDPDSEEVLGLEVRVVQRVNIRAKLPAQHAGEIMAIRDGCDGVELRFQRSDSLRLDGCFVHEARVEVGDLPGILACGRSGLGRLLNEGQCAFPRLVGQHCEDAVTRLVGGNGRSLDPSAIGIRIEIVTRSDGRVHACQIDTCRKWRWRRPASWHSCDSNGEENGG